MQESAANLEVDLGALGFEDSQRYRIILLRPSTALTLMISHLPHLTRKRSSSGSVV